MTNPTPPKPNTLPTTPDTPKAEPNNALADSVTVKAGIVSVKQWMGVFALVTLSEIREISEHCGRPSMIKSSTPLPIA